MAERTLPAEETAPEPPGRPDPSRRPDPTRRADAATRRPDLTRRPEPEAIATPMQFATALAELREQAGIGVRDLARTAGTTSATLSDWFAGRRLPARAAAPVLDAVLGACGVPGPARGAWIDALTRVRRLPGAEITPAPEPYRGLASYRVEDAGWFFGRERLVARLVALVTSGSAGVSAVLVGPSGCGKSSALQAGLAARLGAGSWQVRTMTPGADPSAALDDALRRLGDLGMPAGSRVTLIVDQFEELFTLCDDETRRRDFVGRLTALHHLPAPRSDVARRTESARRTDGTRRAGGTRRPSGVRGPGGGEQAAAAGAAVSVVIAVRAELVGRALQYAALATAFQDRQVVVAPMSDDDLRHAVAEPARAAGIQPEPGLVELLVHDCPEWSRDLPLLSFALMRTWQRGRDSRRLTVEDYVACGGVGGAVAEAAEAVYEGLPAAGRELARRLFLRLVAVCDDGIDARRPASAADLGLDSPEGDPTAEVVEKFVAAGLVTTTGTSVCLAHEALCTAWPRLRAWVDRARVDRLTHRRLARAAAIWDRDGRDPAALYRGTALAQARSLLTDRGPTDRRPTGPGPTDGESVLTATERDFLTAAIAAQARGRQRAGRPLRTRTAAARTLLAAAAIVTVAATSVAVVARGQASTARHERDRAVSRQLAATADDLRSSDASLAGQIALVAWRTSPTTQARAALLALAASPLATSLPGPGGRTWVATGGGTAAAVGDTSGVRIWSVARSDSTGSSTGGSGGADAVRVTPIDAGSAADPGPLNAVAVSRDGTLVIAGGASGVLYAWRVTAGRAHPLPDLAVGHGAIADLATSAVGDLVAATTHDGHLVLATSAGAGLRLVGAPFAASVGGSAAAVAFSPDARTLAAGGPTGRVRLWSLDDPTHPRPTATADGVTAAITSVAFTPGGGALAAGSVDHHAVVWQLSSLGSPQLDFDSGQPVTGVAFAAHGTVLAVAGADGHVRVYDTTTHARSADLAQPGATTSITYLADGRTPVVGDADGRVRLWSLPTGTPPTDAAVAAVRICAVDGSVDRAAWARALPDVPYTSTC